MEDNESDQNRNWLGAVRPSPDSGRWRYLEQPSPPEFDDGSVSPWGKNQPDDRTNDNAFQSNLMAGRLRSWPSKGFDDSQ